MIQLDVFIFVIECWRTACRLKVGGPTRSLIINLRCLPTPPAFLHGKTIKCRRVGQRMGTLRDAVCMHDFWAANPNCRSSIGPSNCQFPWFPFLLQCFFKFEVLQKLNIQESSEYFESFSGGAGWCFSLETTRSQVSNKKIIQQDIEYCDWIKNLPRVSSIPFLWTHGTRPVEDEVVDVSTNVFAGCRHCSGWAVVCLESAVEIIKGMMAEIWISSTM